jgi:hypothetical protein
MSQRAQRDVMWDRVGLVRDGEGLREALGVIDRVERELAHGIALERLHLDDVRAALREELPAEGHRDELAELHDLDPGEGPALRHAGILPGALTSNPSSGS